MQGYELPWAASDDALQQHMQCTRRAGALVYALADALA